MGLFELIFPSGLLNVLQLALIIKNKNYGYIQCSRAPCLLKQ